MKILKEEFRNYSVKLTMNFKLNCRVGVSKIIDKLNILCNELNLDSDSYIDKSSMIFYDTFYSGRRNPQSKEKSIQTKYFKFDDLNKVLKVLSRFYYRLKVMVGNEELKFDLEKDDKVVPRLIITVKKDYETDDYYLNMDKVFKLNLKYFKLMAKSTLVETSVKYTEDMVMKEAFNENDIELINQFKLKVMNREVRLTDEEYQMLLGNKSISHSLSIFLMMKDTGIALDIDSAFNIGISYNLFHSTFSLKELTAYVKFCIGMTERGLTINSRKSREVKDSENSKFTMRNLLRKVGFNGEYNSDVRHFFLKNLIGNSARR